MDDTRRAETLSHDRYAIWAPSEKMYVLLDPVESKALIVQSEIRCDAVPSQPAEQSQSVINRHQMSLSWLFALVAEIKSAGLPLAVLDLGLKPPL
jgi:hypothetical protein